MSNKNSISYRRVGDFLISNLILPPEEANVRLGKWGAGVRWTPLQSRSTDRAGRRDMMHKDYMLKHKKVTVTIMTAEGKFWQYLAEVDKQAEKMFDSLVEQMKESEGITEQLKAENQMKWVQRMSNIEAQAREVVNRELIFA